MCNVDDCDWPEIYREKHVLAKKHHTCTECRGHILPSEPYKYVFGKWNGSVSIFKICVHCQVPQKWLEVECGGYLFGELYSEILEHAQEYKKMFLYRWCVEIKKRRRAASELRQEAQTPIWTTEA